MPMIVQNKGDKGNPYHDEEGKFTTADDVTDGEHTIRTSNPLKISKKIDGQSPREKTELEKYYQDFKNRKNVKPVTEMSQEELLKENSENLTYLKSKGIDLSEMKDLFNGDLKLKCANLRGLREAYDKMNLDFNGLKISKNGRLKTCAGRAQSSLGEWTGRYNNNFEAIYRFSFGTEIEMAGGYFSSYDFVLQHAKSEAVSGYKAKVEDANYPGYTMVHEFGHIVHAKILEDKFGGKNEFTRNEFNEEKYRINDKIIREIYSEFQDENPGISYINFYNQTSRYSRTNMHEWFAENYISLMGGTPTSTAKAFGKWLVKNGYMKGE